jgi:hypothetical protein
MPTEIPSALIWLRLIDRNGDVLERKAAVGPEDARDVALTVIGRRTRLDPGMYLICTRD